MRAGVMSASVFGIRGVAPVPEREESASTEKVVRATACWSAEKFAEEQIRGLVRVVFSPNASPLARQVVFGAVEPDTDVKGICYRVGEMLAAETRGDVAVVVTHSHDTFAEASRASSMENGETGQIRPLREAGLRLQSNLWLLRVSDSESDDGCAASLLHKYLGEIRREFEYSIVAAAGGSSQGLAMAQFADGMILVLSAPRTRRIAARRIRDALQAAHVRLLGTVLNDREFPIPEAIYRRL
jgi:hypothetical protein